jgi:hypothetical protein
MVRLGFSLVAALPAVFLIILRKHSVQYDNQLGSADNAHGAP